MNKNLVIYSTLTGNTKEVAEAIYTMLPQGSDIFSAADIQNIDFDQYQNIFVGFWVDKGTADQLAQVAIKSLKNKRIALFGTVGAPPDMVPSDGSAPNYGTKCLNNAATLFDPSCKIVTRFICQGRISAKMTEAFKQFPAGHPHAMTPERMARHQASQAHPDVNDLDAAKKFALESLKTFDCEAVNG